MAKEIKPELKATPPVKVIYIGPSIPNVGLSKNSIFNNGIPEQLNKLIKQNSLIGNLVVSISEFSKSSAQLSVSTSVESQAVKKLLLTLGGNK